MKKVYKFLFVLNLYILITFVVFSCNVYAETIDRNLDNDNLIANTSYAMKNMANNALILHESEQNMKNLDLDKSITLVEPEQFGAKGDGHTDDTEALQHAINSGFRVHLRNSYIVSGVILPSGTYVYGTGKIIQKETIGGIPAIIATNASNITFKNISLQSQSFCYHTRIKGAFVFNNCTNINLQNIRLVSNADRNLVFKNCDNSHVDHFYSTGQGTVATFFNCNNSSVTQGIIFGTKTNKCHGIDFYADNGFVSKNNYANNLIGLNSGSSVIQVTAGQATGSDYASCEFTDIAALNCNIAMKTDGVSIAEFKHIYAKNCNYGVSATGISTHATVNVVIDNCIFENNKNNPHFAIVTSDKYTQNLTCTNTIFINCEKIVSDCIKGTFTFKSNAVESLTETSITFGKEGSMPSNIIMQNNLFKGNIISIRYPSGATNSYIFENNKIILENYTVNTIPTFYSLDYFKFVNNTFLGKNPPTSFRIRKPTWYTGENEPINVTYYGNMTNDKQLSLDISGSDKLTETL